MPSRLIRLLLPLLLLAITALAYWPGLSGGFLFDDYPNILQQERVHATTLDLASLKRAAGGYAGPVGRPVATISFAVNHVLGGLDPWGYKFGGLLVHLANALLVFALLLRLPPPGGDTTHGRHAAGALALIWAIHPLQVSSVLYVVQRMETLSLTFVLLALIAYLHGRRRQIAGLRGWPWLAACLPLVAFGLLSKESAILFPAYALALELTVLGFAAATPAATRRWKLGYAAAAVAAIGFFAAVVLPVYLEPAAYAVRDFTVGERLLTQLRVLPMYLGWILLPRPGAYAFYYDNFAFSTGLLQPLTTLAGAVFLAALAAAAIALRRRLPLFSLGVLWFFAGHLLTSNVVPLELAFEHRNYFALLGVVLAAFALLQGPAKRLDAGARRMATGALLVGLFGLCVIRSAGWGSPLELAMELAAKNPLSPRASTDLGEQYMIHSRNDPASPLYRMAEAEFERGSRVPNATLMPEQGLLVLAANAGRPSRPEWWDRVDAKLRERAIGPQEMGVMMGLLRSRDDMAVFDDRRFAQAYTILAERTQLSPLQLYAFGMHALERAHDDDLAADFFARAAVAGRARSDFLSGMVLELSTAGHAEQAERLKTFLHDAGIAEVEIGAYVVEDETP